jgi:molybdopterin/thiamine biosynthesis adenylyltransferase
MNDDLDRYHRQMLLRGFGESGQRRLQDATVLLLGCGALGSVAADLLARAGVGHLVIVDRDVVEATNLQRQVLFDEQDVATGMPKAAAAQRHIARTNSQVRVTAIVDDLNHTNIGRLAGGADLLLDGLDNLETRYLANDLAVDRGIPYVYGAAVATSGMAFTVMPAGEASTACLRCLFEEPPPPGTMPTCDTVGVLATAITTIASFQVGEALKILTGNLDKLSRRMLQVDVWDNEVYQIEAARKDDCPCCGQRRFEYLSGRAGSSAAVLCGRDAVQLRRRQSGEVIDLGPIAARLDGLGEVSVNEFLLRAELSDGDKPFEITLFTDGRAIIKGTQELDVARGIYSKYVGT